MPTSLDLIGAHPWRSAVFTTYSLSLSFFEALILDQLVRGGARGALILSDVDGVRGALSESGARRAGKEYDIEPVSVSSGVFHPKLSVLSSEDECHLLVGSGNLTFGGWGGNFEVFEHLHSEFAADAIRDAADFFSSLADTPRVRHGARPQCLETADSLSESVAGRASSGKIRLIHNLQRSILDQVSEFVEDLAGAQRIVLCSPYWQAGAALDSICDALRMDCAFVHSHPSGIVRGSFGSNWPRGAKSQVDPICIDAFNVEGDRRLLHAKVFEIVCKRGRLLVSGSANATNAALGNGQNVETCIVRIETDNIIGWTLSPAEPPEELSAPDDEQDKQEDCGILRAALDADTVFGQVLSPRLKGRADAFLLSSDGPQKLGSIELDGESQFSILVKGLELKILQGQRFTFAVQTDGVRAEGFISVTAFSEISRRSGSLTAKLIALLGGNETPEDLAAIMSWICEDPNRLNRNILTSGHPAPHEDPAEVARTIDISSLRLSLDVGMPTARPGGAGSNAAWQRFVDAIVASFRERRKSFLQESDTNEDPDEEEGISEQNRPPPPSLSRAFDAFNQVFEALLSGDNGQRFFTVAFDMAQYVCRRLEPVEGIVCGWLRELIHVHRRLNLQLEAPHHVAAIMLILGSLDRSLEGRRSTRLQLLRGRFSLEADCPSMAGVDGFISALSAEADFNQMWAEIKDVKTMPEQVQAFLNAIASNSPANDYPDLRRYREEWLVLERAIESPEDRDEFEVVAKGTTVCPKCYRTLPSAQIENLRTRSLGMAKMCCNRVLLCAEI